MPHMTAFWLKKNNKKIPTCVVNCAAVSGMNSSKTPPQNNMEGCVICNSYLRSPTQCYYWE